MIERLFRIDLKENRPAPPTVNINQGSVDMYDFVFKIYDGENEIDYSFYESARLTLSKDGKTAFLSSPCVIEADRKRIVYEVEPEALGRAGEITGQLDLSVGAENLATMYFKFFVVGSLANLDEASRIVYISDIAEAVKNVEAANDTVNEINGIFRQLQEDMAAGVWKGDKGDKGNTGATGPQGPKGSDGSSVDIQRGTYREPGSSKPLPDLPQFANTRVNQAFLVDDEEKEGQLDLYIHTPEASDWTIVDNWGGVPGPQGVKGDDGVSPVTIYLSRQTIVVPCGPDRKALRLETEDILFDGFVGTTQTPCTVGNFTVIGASVAITQSTATAKGKIYITFPEGWQGVGTGKGDDDLVATMNFSCNGVAKTFQLAIVKQVEGDTGEKGEKGERGSGLSILGRFDTLAELQTAYPDGSGLEGGFMVGSNYYFWDIKTKEWEDGGLLKGEDGEDGVSPVSVYLSRDTIVIPCGPDRKSLAQETPIIDFKGFVGTTQVACTVSNFSITGATITITQATASTQGTIAFNFPSGWVGHGTGVSYDNNTVSALFYCNGIGMFRSFTVVKQVEGAGYAPPVDGIPLEDLAQEVRDELDGAIRREDFATSNSGYNFVLTSIDGSIPDKDKVILRKYRYDPTNKLRGTVDTTINSATSGRAGAMSAQHVTDLDDLKSNAMRKSNYDPLIPSQASADNKLATEEFVNSTVTHMTAHRVTYNADGAGFPTFAALRAATVFYHGGEVWTPTEHDYATVLADETAPYPYIGGQTIAEFDGKKWAYAYGLNEEPYTAAETAAIGSGITAALVNQIKNPPKGLSWTKTLELGEWSDTGSGTYNLFIAVFCEGMTNTMRPLISVNDPSDAAQREAFNGLAVNAFFETWKDILGIYADGSKWTPPGDIEIYVKEVI